MREDNKIRISLRVTPEQLAFINEMAVENEISVSNVVRQIIRDAMHRKNILNKSH